MFAVQVAADIFGNKLNFEFAFPARPSIAELSRTVESAFSVEIVNQKPDSVPSHTFHVAKMKVYDDEKSKWVDLTSEGQLFDYCQVYAFQPENPWHKETQKPIPPAVKPPQENKPVAANTNNKYNSGQRSGGPPTSTSSALAPYTGGRVNETNGARRPHGSNGSAVSNALALRTASAADVSPEEKLRVVFAEFDTKGVRMIDPDDLRDGFHNLGLDFSSTTVADLFERADLNRDGRISYAEFERFAKLYPIMMDCLFFRSKAFWEEEQLRKEIQAERDAVSKAEATLDSAQRQLETAEEDVGAALGVVRAADEEVKDATARMRDLAKEMDDAKKERDRVLKDRKEREKDLQDAKEREKEARKVLQEMARDGDKLERRAAALASDADAAEDKVRQLQKALEEAKRAADRAVDAANQAADEASKAKEREKDAALQADMIARDIPKIEDSVRLSDRNVGAADQVLKDLDNVGKDLGREADEAARRRDAGERAVADAKDRAAQRARDLEHARQAVDDRDRAAKQRETDLEEHRRQRQLVTQHERALIDQELRLREQRDNLETQETRLLSEATSFLGNMRNAMSAGRSYSRDPSAF